MLFWTNTVSKSSKPIGNDYEVDELCSLFYKYVKDNSSMFSTAGKIVEDDILNILRFYFPDIEISFSILRFNGENFFISLYGLV